MYCQSCGTEIQPGLNYCNRCGAQVTGLATAQDERVVLAPLDVTGPVRWLAATICLTMILGFTIFFIGIAALAGRGVATDPLVIIAGLGLTGIFAVELSLIRMMSRLIFEGREQRQLASPKKSGAKKLRPASRRSSSPRPRPRPARCTASQTTPRARSNTHTWSRALKHLISRDSRPASFPPTKKQSVKIVLTRALARGV